MNKRIILPLALLSAFAFSTSAENFAGKKVSILGDSYSTFAGHVTPAENNCWYGPGINDSVNDVRTPEQTWWQLLIDATGMQLERNNSYSGATICDIGYYKADVADRSYVTRMGNLGYPDVILIFGGTNDSWAGSPIGEFVYEGWSRRQLDSFRPAFAYLLHGLQTLYPDATIFNLVNSDLSADVTESMAEICKHYGVNNIELQYIDKQSGHPSLSGMRQIADQVKKAMDAK